MPRRPKTAPRRAPRQQRAEDTIEVLLLATEKVFARDGFVAATTNRIAEVAGVSIGTLYHYFPTKEALIEAIVHRMWTAEVAVVEARAPLLLEGSLETAIRELVAAIASRVASHRALYMRWYAEAPHLGKLEFGLDLTDRGTALVRLALARHEAQLWPRDLDFAADFVVKMTLAAVRTAARDYPKQLASGAFAEELTQMLVRYLCRPSAPATTT